MGEVIARTRHEITELGRGSETDRARDELHAVVQCTEQATNKILTSSEAVDALARGIADRTGDDTTRAEAQAIRSEMLAIFEACNFQDLTGQRVSKVVRTIVEVEGRIREILRLWSDDGNVPPSVERVQGTRGEEEALLNGPALPGDASVSQDAVDAMFP